jgi:hypothetical protein
MKKHLIVSLTIGACLLLPSAGAVFATDPHKGVGLLPAQQGRPGGGTGVGIQCGGVPGITVGLPAGQAAGGSSSSSPFVNSMKPYAGAGAGNSNNANGHPAAQYDVSCFQHQVP